MGITYYNEADNSFDASIAYMKNKSTDRRTEFADRKYLAAIETTDDILVGSFEKETSEGYMLVNFGNPEAETAKDIEITLELKGGAKYLAVYGGKGSGGNDLCVRYHLNGELHGFSARGGSRDLRASGEDCGKQTGFLIDVHDIRRIGRPDEGFVLAVGGMDKHKGIQRRKRGARIHVNR